MYIDDCRLKGVVNLVLRDKDGKVKQHKTIRNKVTKDGIAHIIGRMIDDGQDRAGKHKMPRMMSHMAIGIGAAARSNKDRYNHTDFDNLPKVLGINDSGGTQANLKVARKQAAIPKAYDRMLQDERGFRVQLMKDTTLSNDYAPLLNVHMEKDGSTAMHSTDSAGNSQLIFTTGSDGGNTRKRLRVGLQVTGLTGSTSNTGPSGGSNNNVKNAQTIKIAKIEFGTPNSTATTVTLDGTLSSPPGGSVTDVHIDVEYVDAIPLTSYNINPSHPTHTGVRSVFEPPSGAPAATGPFAAATTRLSALSGYTAANYHENGKGLLGITRGQIGAFYERELEYNIRLTHTDADGLPIDLNANPSGNTNVATTVDEAAFAILDTGNVARFPFVGAEEDKPSGTATVGASATAGTNTASTRGTEFIQFGTAVDGIFQGALVGSSIVANSADGTAEGYPPEENNYGVAGGLNISGTGVDAIASTFSAFLNYDFGGGTYAPNAVAGAKKNGDRIVYVATFKENNPRPEQDYDRFSSTAGTLRAPLNRIYPITEAGIFNKHIPDIGVFDVGDRAYTSTDGDATTLAHIDQRANTATGTTIDYTLTSGTDHNPVEGVLTQDGKTITAAAFGFTKGPLTQTMLCRTTFDPVNKATADTLQITWSVQLQDLT
jgi:hypothetical protein